MKTNVKNKIMVGIFAATSMYAGTPILNKSENVVFANTLKSNDVFVTKDEVLKHEDVFKGKGIKVWERYLGGIEEPIKGYNYIKGTKPILISAPHSVKQPARGNYNDGYGYKLADSYTGAIAKIISEKTGAHVIYKTATKSSNSNTMMDENYTTELTAYRKQIKEVVEKYDIKAVIDIHGFNDSNWDNVIEIGTGYGKNLLGKQEILDSTLEALAENGFKVSNGEYVPKSNKVKIDTKFTASANYVLSSYVSKNFGVPSIQMEFGSSYRNVNDMNKFNKTINSLVDIVDNISKIEAEGKYMAKIVDVNKAANMRKEGNANSELITSIAKGEHVTVLEDNANSSWVKVRYKDKVGYIYGKYAQPLKGTVKSSQNVTTCIYMRDTADKDANKIQAVRVGETVNILNILSDNKWCKVSYINSYGKTITGYVYVSSLAIG